MNYIKKPIATSIALVLGAAGVIDTASAVSFTFQNNTTATQPGSTLVGFDAGREFNLTTPYGSQVNNGPKDIISGGEQWIFDGDANGALMTGVANTYTNTSGHSGANGVAPLTSGVAGFPIATTPGTHDTLFQAFELTGAGEFTFLAPTTSSASGQVFGAANLSSFDTIAGTFSINIPVLHAQWADTAYFIGGDGDGNDTHNDPANQCTVTGGCPGPGVTFTGTLDGAGSFEMWASRVITQDEITIGGFNEQIVEFSLQGSYALSSIPIPATAWLFGSGLLGLISIARRKKPGTS